LGFIKGKKKVSKVQRSKTKRLLLDFSSLTHSSQKITPYERGAIFRLMDDRTRVLQCDPNSVLL